MLRPDHRYVACYRYEEIADTRCIHHRHHPVAIHHSLKGFSRVHLDNDHVCAKPLRTHGDAPSAPAVSDDDNGLPGKEHIRCIHDPVDRALPGSVPVVKHHLGLGIVYSDHRISECAVCCHCSQPYHAGCGLLAAADDAREQFRMIAVQERDRVCAVIERDMRIDLDRLLEALVILLLVLPPDREYVRSVCCESGCNVVLCAERI